MSEDEQSALPWPPGRWLIILPPLLFLLVFFLVPFAFALKISFAEQAARVPPFTDILAAHRLSAACAPPSLRQPSMYLLSDEIYGYAYLYSLRTACFSTLICLALGYPMAYAIARTAKVEAQEHPAADPSIAATVLDLLPATGLRARGLIRDNGLLNTVLLPLGLIDPPA